MLPSHIIHITETITHSIFPTQKIGDTKNTRGSAFAEVLHISSTLLWRL